MSITFVVQMFVVLVMFVDSDVLQSSKRAEVPFFPTI